MNSVPLNTVSTVDAICSALEHDIFHLHFAPGEKITEQELASRYNVSRNTLREAVAHLLAQGLLIKTANRGVFVRKIGVEDVQDIFLVRALLEQEAVCRLTDVPEIPAQLWEYVEIMEGTDRQVPWEDYVRADIRFHAALVAAAGSPRRQKLYDTIQTEVKLCIFQTRSYVAFPGGNPTPHRTILEAIEKRDTAAAQALLHEHICDVIKRYSMGVAAMAQSG